jgi:3-hydroxybutyryl-CoA dehydratase
MSKISDFKIGDSASLEKVFTDEDVKTFARISLDCNPIHIDEEYAAKSPFGKKVVHGILQAGLISAVLGTKLPGEGAIYRDQTLTFKKPAFIGDKLIATVEITEMKERMGLLIMKTTVRNEKGDLLVKGEAKGIVSKG